VTREAKLVFAAHVMHAFSMPVHNPNMTSVNPRDDLAETLDAPLDVSGLAPQWNSKLQALSREEYDKLRAHVRRIISPDLCDPDEALLIFPDGFVINTFYDSSSRERFKLKDMQKIVRGLPFP
jgi:hypothetical protein